MNTDHTMIYAHRRHKFTLEKVHTNILHLGLEWLFFWLYIHLQYITDVLLVILMLQGSPLQASERPEQAILPSDKTSLGLFVQRTKLFEVKKSCKQQKTDLVVPESPWGC